MEIWKITIIALWVIWTLFCVRYGYDAATETGEFLYWILSLLSLFLIGSMIDWSWLWYKITF